MSEPATDDESTTSLMHSSTTTTSQRHSSTHSSSSSSSSSTPHNRLRSLPKCTCCCYFTPFVLFLLLLFCFGFSFLLPGIVMRSESLPDPTPQLLMQLCRQPNTIATSTLDRFRETIDSHSRHSTGGEEEPYDGVRLSTSALSVYVGSQSHECAEESAYEGSPQVIPLPDSLLYASISYIMFLTLPSYVVGGEISMRLMQHNRVVFNISTSLHAHRYPLIGEFYTKDEARHDVDKANDEQQPPSSVHHLNYFLSATHPFNTKVRVYNPALAPLTPLSRYQRRHSSRTSLQDEDCQFKRGCQYKLSAVMNSLILTETSFNIIEEESTSALSSSSSRPPANDESHLVHANSLRLVIDRLVIIESNELAERDTATAKLRSQAAAAMMLDDPDAEGEGDIFPSSDELYRPSSSSSRTPTLFITPDILLSFHQSELTPMQQQGVKLIIQGSLILLLACAILYIKWMSGDRRRKER